jgi:hypothetical protein
MEPKEDNVEAIAEELAETVKPVTSTPETVAMTAASTSVDDSLKISSDLWEKVKQLWEQYFGEGKKSNLTLAIIIIATIPILIATSTLVDFLNKLPLLPSLFELVGFGYSVWFIYRYLLLADTRKELINGINAWKQKVFG